MKGRTIALMAKSSWQARVGQAVVFLAAVAAIAIFGHANASAVLGETLTVLFAVFVLLRFPNLASFEGPWGIKVKVLDMHEEISKARESEPPLAPALPQAGAPAPPALNETTSHETKVAKGDEGAGDDPWRRCGNVYWLASDTVFAAFALSQGNFDKALRGVEHAINHAAALPVPPELVSRLRRVKLRAPYWSKVEVAQQSAGELLRVADDIGKVVSLNDPNFAARDIHEIP